MLKLTKTGIGLLTKQYRSVLKKCLLLNLGLLTATAVLTITHPKTANAEIVYSEDSFRGQILLRTASTLHKNNGFKIFDLDEEHTYHNIVADLYNDWRGGGTLELYSWDSSVNTTLTYHGFSLNNSSYATGIDFATNITAGTTNASHLATTGAVNQLLNYYYTFRDDKTAEDIEFAEENDSLSLMEVCHA